MDDKAGICNNLKLDRQGIEAVEFFDLLGDAQSAAVAWSADPLAPLPDGLEGWCEMRPDIDYPRHGLERHVVLACAQRDLAGAVAMLAKVGCMAAWTGFDVVAVDAVALAGRPELAHLNQGLGRGTVSWYADVPVQESCQVISPSAVPTIAGRADWDAWEMVVARVSTDPGIAEQFAGWTNRHVLSMTTPQRSDEPEPTLLALLDGKSSSLDDEALRHAWESGAWMPRISVLPRLASQTVSVALLLADLSPDQQARLDALVSCLPLATVLSGNGTVHHAQGKQRAVKLELAIATLPANNIPLFLFVAGQYLQDRVGLDNDQIAIIPYITDMAIAFPEGYPRANPFLMGLDTARPIPAVQQGRGLSLEEHWAFHERRKEEGT
jgi:hypothetical protein